MLLGEKSISVVVMVRKRNSTHNLGLTWMNHSASYARLLASRCIKFSFSGETWHNLLIDSLMAGETMSRCLNSLRIFSVVWIALKNIAHELAIDFFVRFGLGLLTTA